MKLTKKDNEFIKNFAATLATNTLLSVLVLEGQQITPDAANTLLEQFKQADISTLTDALVVAIEENGVDLKALIKIDKYLSSPDVVAVLRATQLVSAAVETQIIATVQEILTEVPEEVA